MTPEAVLEKVINKVSRRGEAGVADLEQAFKRMDERSDGYLDYDDFKFGLRDRGVDLVDEEIALIARRFDCDGFVSFREFIDAIRASQETD